MEDKPQQDRIITTATEFETVDKAKWKTIDQIMVNNIGVELLELETGDGEIKQFIGVTKYERTKSVVFNPDMAKEIAEAILTMLNEYKSPDYPEIKFQRDGGRENENYM